MLSFNLFLIRSVSSSETVTMFVQNGSPQAVLPSFVVVFYKQGRADLGGMMKRLPAFTEGFSHFCTFACEMVGNLVVSIVTCN